MRWGHFSPGDALKNISQQDGKDVHKEGNFADKRIKTAHGQKRPTQAGKTEQCLDNADNTNEQNIPVNRGFTTRHNAVHIQYQVQHGATQRYTESTEEA